MVKVALAQFGCTEDKEANLVKILRLIREAGANGAQLICLPELSNTFYFCNGVNYAHFDLAEPIPGPSTQRVAEVAKELGMVVIFPLFEKVLEGEFYNSAAVIGSEGELLGRYRKTMLPSSHRPGVNYIEKFYFRPGNLPYPIFETLFGIKIGIAICYDRHFPEAIRCLALKGADVIFFPSATGGFTQPLWELELKAHAFFNLLYTAGVNKVGPELGQAKGPFFGMSMLVGPKGDVVARGGEDEEIVYGEVDVGLIRAARLEWWLYRDRRPELYSIIAQSHDLN
jgi:beta-ureidopropionase